jgi:hypothetical protein
MAQKIYGMKENEKTKLNQQKISVKEPIVNTAPVLEGDFKYINYDTRFNYACGQSGTYLFIHCRTHIWN